MLNLLLSSVMLSLSPRKKLKKRRSLRPPLLRLVRITLRTARRRRRRRPRPPRQLRLRRRRRRKSLQMPPLLPRQLSPSVPARLVRRRSAQHLIGQD